MLRGSPKKLPLHVLHEIQAFDRNPRHTELPSATYTVPPPLFQIFAHSSHQTPSNTSVMIFFVHEKKRQMIVVPHRSRSDDPGAIQSHHHLISPLPERLIEVFIRNEFMKITDSLLCIIHRLIFQKSLPDHMHGRDPVFVLCPSDLIAIHHLRHTAPSLRFRIRDSSVLRRSPGLPCRSTARCPPSLSLHRLHSGVHVCHFRTASR